MRAKKADAVAREKHVYPGPRHCSLAPMETGKKLTGVKTRGARGEQVWGERRSKGREKMAGDVFYPVVWG